MKQYFFVLLLIRIFTASAFFPISAEGSQSDRIALFAQKKGVTLLGALAHIARFHGQGKLHPGDLFDALQAVRKTFLPKDVLFLGTVEEAAHRKGLSGHKHTQFIQAVKSLTRTSHC